VILTRDGGLIVIRFDRKPSRDVLDRVKSAGFKPIDALAYGRRNDHNGRCAADYFKAHYEEALWEIRQREAGQAATSGAGRVSVPANGTAQLALEMNGGAPVRARSASPASAASSIASARKGVSDAV
jgi:hypothetical protein